MSEQLNDLILKIKKQGIEEAESKAQEIEVAAKEKADALVAQAKTQAEGILQEAKQNIETLEVASQKRLKQASRDILLEFRDKINGILMQILNKKLDEAFSPQTMARMVIGCAEAVAKAGDYGQLNIVLSPSDLKLLKSDLLKELKNEIKKPIVFESADTIDKGFVLSFDEGKSSFDFSNESLCEYFGRYVNQELAQILNQAG